MMYIFVYTKSIVISITLKNQFQDLLGIANSNRQRSLNIFFRDSLKHTLLKTWELLKYGHRISLISTSISLSYSCEDTCKEYDTCSWSLINLMSKG
jgi:hypothetical protein